MDRVGYIAVRPDEALMLDENGNTIDPSEHDIFTGSEADGTVAVGATCQDWTSDLNADVARVGHTDIPSNPMFSPSWNSAHDTAGCSTTGVANFNGGGLIYCFATD